MSNYTINKKIADWLIEIYPNEYRIHKPRVYSYFQRKVDFGLNTERWVTITSNNKENGNICFHFHYDWRQLMRVVTKIVSLKFLDGENCKFVTFGMISEETGEYMVRFNRHILHYSDSLFKATYLATVDFIESYEEKYFKTI